MNLSQRRSEEVLNEYLEDLRRGLEERDIEDPEEVFSYFKEMISDRMENGESEKEIIDALGDPEKLLEAIGERKQRSKGKVSEGKNSIAFHDIRDIDIDVESYDIRICSCNEEMGRIEFDSCEDISLDVDIDGDELKIDQRNSGIFIDSLFRKIFHSDHNFSGAARIYVPKGRLDMLDIETVSGDLKLNGLKIEELDIETVSGDIELSDVSFDEGEINAVSGDIVMEDVVCHETLKSETVSGDIEGKGLSFYEMKASTVSGDLTVLLKGRREDYSIRKQGLKDSRVYQGDGDRILRFDTVSGDLDCRFEE